MSDIKLRPINDWVLVKMDPIPEKMGSLFTVHGDRVRQGIVLSHGPGRKVKGRYIPIGIEKGERVVFFRETLEHQQGKQIVASLKDLGEDLGLIKGSDILFVIAPGENITVSS